MKLRFNAKYALAFVAIFLVEACIALYVHDRVIRPYVGDVLVILLIYAFVRMLFEVRDHVRLAAGILLFAYLVEVGQYFDWVTRLGLADSRLATVVMGTAFDWRDLLSYTIGGILLLCTKGAPSHP